MEKEERVRNITQLYYSKPEVQEAILKFAKDREVVPRYFEQFGKRPDVLQYPGDILNLVRKGATSFHSSEELWNDALNLNADLTRKELNELRKGWDLVIDIDSPFLDCSKIAARLIAEALEYNGVKNYGIKFSGKKGFHILVSWKAFPKEFNEEKTKDMFPEWPRIICSYLMHEIKEKYYLEAGKILSEEEISKRTNLSVEELTEIKCENCGNNAKKGIVAELICPVCRTRIQRKNIKLTKKKLRCINDKCSGFLELENERTYYYCGDCKDFENKNMQLNSDKYPELFKKSRGVGGIEKVASLDLVLVAPRHLFRMPYSLHEKTALVSVVVSKDEIENFDPRNANPLNIKIKNFLPENIEGEAKRLLAAALDWRKGIEVKEKRVDEKKEIKEYAEINSAQITEEMFPSAIKKLLLGLEDGKKRGLFVLLTFLKSLNFPSEYIIKKVKEWNEKNEPPLRDSYIKGQLDWHLKQKNKILPPNYDKDAFYKDLKLIDSKPESKNPVVDVLKRVRRKNKHN